MKETADKVVVRIQGEEYMRVKTKKGLGIGIITVCMLLSIAMFQVLTAPFAVKASSTDDSEADVLIGEENKVSAADFGNIYENNIFPSNVDDVFYYIAKAAYTNEWGYESDVYVIKKYDTLTGKISQIGEIKEYPNAFCYMSDKLYYIDCVNDKTGVYCVNLKAGSTKKLFSASGFCQDIEVDAKGRVYLSGCDWSDDKGTIYVYSTSGKLIAQGTSEGRINSLFAVDSRNGNIYYCGDKNWNKTLDIARLGSDNTVTFSKNNCYVGILENTGDHTDDDQVELLGGKYLAGLLQLTFSNETVFILDSMIPSPKQVTGTPLSVKRFDNAGSIDDVLYLSRADAVVGAAKTMRSDYKRGGEESGVGSRSAYLESGSSKRLFVATDDKEITEYDPDTGKSVSVIATKRPIYKVMTTADKLVLLEKENGKYYVEVPSISYPTKISISGKSSLICGESAGYKIITDSTMTSRIDFTSSDSSVLTIDENGNADAWMPGTATITAKFHGLTAKYKVTVSAPASASKGESTYSSSDSENVNDNDYSTYGAVVGSYLTQIDANTLMRVEYVGDGNIIVKYCDRNGKEIVGKIINTELDIFGGFYAGKDYYFIVTGQTNTAESNDAEVLRVTRYDKNWNRKGAAHVYGANTLSPTHAGSLRMAENAGILYIHTCHTMFKSSDGLNHQANMTFEIKESDMSVKDSHYSVYNYSVGYVSHSFNQFIRISDGMVYRVDHGDAYPRAVTFTGYPVSGQMTSPVVRSYAVEIPGQTGANYTGVSVGGFELSRMNGIIAYNQDIGDSYSSGRNVKLAVVNRSTGSSVIKQITNYRESDGVSCNTPQLVKLNDGHFILMWIEEYSSTSAADSSQACRIAKIDSFGNVIGSIAKKPWKLSDCQPIVLSDGTLEWYVTTKESYSYNYATWERIKVSDNEIRFYNVDPMNLTGTEEDSKQDTVKVQKTAAQLGITIVQPTMVFTGSGLKPAVTVKDGNVLLKLNTDYTLSYKNNVNIGTGSVIITGKGNYTGSVTKSFVITKDKTEKLDVSYRTYVQTYGWQGWVKDGTTSGTSAAAKRMEGLQIKLSKKETSGGIKYRSYVQTYGWQEWVENGKTSGTMGLKKRVESLQIKLTGNIAAKYDLYYRVYAQGYGWLGWAKNGATSGTAGFGKRIEAIQILPVEKGGKGPSGTKAAYIKS